MRCARESRQIGPEADVKGHVCLTLPSSCALPVLIHTAIAELTGNRKFNGRGFPRTQCLKRNGPSARNRPSRWSIKKEGMSRTSLLGYEVLFPNSRPVRVAAASRVRPFTELTEARVERQTKNSSGSSLFRVGAKTHFGTKIGAMPRSARNTVLPV